MTHAKRFAGIPMSKTMREICKEEDYAFLEKVEDSRDKGAEQDKLEEEKMREHHEERIRRSQERKQKEEERQRELEEMRKQKEQEWKNHVAELAAEREGALKERALRLREFRSFQRKVHEKEMDLGQGNGCEKIECD
ncbi:U2 small nuclear ribonucleoprotein auxiliary factor 35 kDa subunit-related protein 1-like [Anguilla rostrata]|uniref:U2 small nuclear ribonucleoprotein auxiliary factor 35 kDa subunit-related protein 1-like n=1 Tax=Anguilla rostrata TaxID=7938 RepID=UPI0030CB1F0C